MHFSDLVNWPQGSKPRPSPAHRESRGVQVLESIERREREYETVKRPMWTVVHAVREQGRADT